MKIYRCNVCGNIVTKAVDGGGELNCCGSPMSELKAGITDAAQEKHVPYLRLNGNVLTVSVGETIHPMTKDHYIQMILVKQGNKVQYVSLDHTQEPAATFYVDPNESVAVYEHCNLHGLWVNNQDLRGLSDDEIVCSAEFPRGCTDQSNE